MLFNVGLVSNPYMLLFLYNCYDSPRLRRPCSVKRPAQQDESSQAVHVYTTNEITSIIFFFEVTEVLCCRCYLLQHIAVGVALVAHCIHIRIHIQLLLTTSMYNCQSPLQQFICERSVPCVSFSVESRALVSACMCVHACAYNCHQYPRTRAAHGTACASQGLFFYIFMNISGQHHQDNNGMACRQPSSAYLEGNKEGWARKKGKHT